MRSLKYQSLILFLFLLVPAIAGRAQDARLNFERLESFEARARDVVEVNIDGKLLDLAKRVTVKVNDENAKKAAEAISGLKGIYVRVYRFENENEYNMADVDALRTQLNSPGWEKLANVRSRKNNQRVDIYTMFSGDVMSGVAVVISEAKSVAIVNVIGPIDIELLAELGGKLNIPKIDIEREKDATQPD
jgi:pyruvate kinase